MIKKSSCSGGDNGLFLVEQINTIAADVLGPVLLYDLTLSQELQPMAAQLSIKAAPESHWLKLLRQRHVAVVRQGPGSFRRQDISSHGIGYVGYKDTHVPLIHEEGYQPPVPFHFYEIRK